MILSQNIIILTSVIGPNQYYNRVHRIDTKIMYHKYNLAVESTGGEGWMGRFWELVTQSSAWCSGAYIELSKILIPVIVLDVAPMHKNDIPLNSDQR